MGKIGAIYSGNFFQHRIFNMEEFRTILKILPACDLPRFDLSKFDALLMAREGNQEVLLANKRKLVRFLDGGGRIISFGEVVNKWLPLCDWRDERIDANTFKIVDETYPLFREISLDDLKWHPRTVHGIFVLYENARPLITGENNYGIMYLDEKSFKGEILATVLDPLCHAGYGLERPMKILKNIIHWSINNK